MPGRVRVTSALLLVHAKPARFPEPPYREVLLYRNYELD